ncbi:MAG: secondary thiamine-phosphate synthase enzyme YjbQ [candidate division Zixibacteria bacterium]|nr:secondary thiamine-phosphate synthase enzyme YjbQ [candidate division Zixibacteria bacterium]
MIEFSLLTPSREAMIDITLQVENAIEDAAFTDGVVVCFVPHTTSAVTINEDSDPDVKRDILHKLKREFPQQDGYQHSEGNSDAHIKTALVGSSATVIVESGKLILGQWQGIYFCEFDGPRTRRVILKLLKA